MYRLRTRYKVSDGLNDSDVIAIIKSINCNWYLDEYHSGLRYYERRGAGNGTYILVYDHMPDMILQELMPKGNRRIDLVKNGKMHRNVHYLVGTVDAFGDWRVRDENL